MFFILTHNVQSQDPHFSQFFMAPQYVNPALIGTQFGDWCVMGNMRQQWGNAFTPFNTQSLAGEYKFNNTGSNNIWAIGGSFMSDQTMNGSFRSTYKTATLVYSQSINDYNYIAAGFQVQHANRRLDYSKLSFGQQFTSRGFDLALPNGESTLLSTIPYYSIGAGMLFTHATKDNAIVIDIGLAAYDINQPIISALGDKYNFLNIRYVGNLNLQYDPSDQVLFNFFSVYHRQATQNYFSLGGSIGYTLEDAGREKIGFLGAWFREGDAIYPFVGLKWQDVQIGLSYDVVISKQNNYPINPQAFELSFIYTHVVSSSRKISRYFECPYKRRVVVFPKF
jgi:type IX secretion system PorP/SprF family membrane protein